MENESFRRVFYFSVFTVIPFLLWIVPIAPLSSITFLLLGIFFIVSRYVKEINYFSDTLEILFLFLLVEYLLNRIGLDNLFPLNHLVSVVALYFFLLQVKKIPAFKLNLTAGNLKHSIGISLIFTVLTVGGLSLWFTFQPENHYAEMVPDVSLPLLILMGIGFALINAVYEEGVFRSILFAHFSRVAGYPLALILQSTWFSFLHYRAGFPSGATGVGLTFVFGLMSGYLVQRTKGLLLPVLIHMVADLSIFILIVLRINQLF